MIKKITIGRIKDLNDALKYIEQLALAINSLADENEKLKARVVALEPLS